MQSNKPEELVIGFLASEGAILKRDELKSVLIDDSKGFAHVELNKDLGDRFSIFHKTNDCILLWKES